MASQQKKWERFDDIYRENAILTKINFQYLSPKESQEYPWYEGALLGFHSSKIYADNFA